jgi:hypothetical protein
MRPHHARQGTVVGDGQRRVAPFLRSSDQLFGVRGTAQKAEVAAAVELGVSREGTW